MNSRRLPIPTRISWITILGYFRYVLFTWLGTLAAVMAFILLMNVLNVRAVSGEAGSVWAYVTHAAAWFVGGLGGYYGYWTAPIYVGHGRTRKEAGQDGLMTLLVVAAGTGTLLIAGFLAEYQLLGALGWPRHIPEAHSFTSHLDVPGMLNVYLPALLLGGATGAAVGALAYRYGTWGWLSVIPGLGLIGAYGLAEDAARFFRPDHMFSATELASVRWLAGLLLAGAALLLTWLTLRRTPVGND